MQSLEKPKYLLRFAASTCSSSPPALVEYEATWDGTRVPTFLLVKSSFYPKPTIDNGLTDCVLLIH